MLSWLTRPPVLIFGLGATELLLIFLVIILLFGAKKIPDIARGLGRSMSEFKKGMHEGGTDDAEKKDPPASPPGGSASPKT